MIRIVDAPRRASETSVEPFAPQTPVHLVTHNWQCGEVKIPAVVVRRISPTHLKLRLVDGGLFVAAMVEDVEIRSEAA